MNKTIIAVAALVFWCFGCAAGNFTGADDSSRAPYSSVAKNTPTEVGKSNLVFDPVVPDTSALPPLTDLPFPASLKKQKKQEIAQRYTGIIKNKTRYEVSVPSENSDATLVIPPHGWTEYTMWTRQADVTAFRDGKPFYCLKLSAHPKEYPFMCQNYDFMAEIVKPEPTEGGKYKPMKKRKYRAKKQPEC